MAVCHAWAMVFEAGAERAPVPFGIADAATGGNQWAEFN